MSTSESPYTLPARTTASDGEPRRVGFELEFARLGLDDVAAILARTLDGDIQPGTKAECVVTSPHGDFKVELDWELGKHLAEERRDRLQALNVDADDDPLMDWLTEFARTVVPVEIVCPPIAIADLDALSPLVTQLREAGAVGTGASPIYAFGVHINPDLPALDTTTIVRYLKAFCIAQQWLVRAHDVDLSRRITPYIDLYPNAYIRMVMDYGDDEPLARLIDDYVLHNPTRNRALDMTPLFRHLDEERLMGHLDDTRINARPTFHYRLPNCSIEQPDWQLADSWNAWCVIETISNDVALLEELTAAWREYDSNLLNLGEAPWHERLDQIHASL